MKYIAKKDTWFKEGTECELIESYDESCGLYRGVYIVSDSEYDKYWYNKGHIKGDEVIMNEVCTHDEFYGNE